MRFWPKRSQCRSAPSTAGAKRKASSPLPSPTGSCFWPKPPNSPPGRSGDPEQARKWLQEPHSLLGEESPLEHMDTVAGIEEIQAMLLHIEHSMPV